MSSKEEVLKVFLAENYENLDHVEQDLLALEKDPAAKDRIARIFRALHSLKGTCGFLGFPRLEELAHAGEGLLGAIRDGKLTMQRRISGAVLALVDAARQILRTIEKSGGEGSVDSRALLERLAEAQKPEPAAPEPVQEAAPSPAAAPAPEVTTAASKIRVDVTLLDKILNLVGELVLARNQVVQALGKNQEPVLVNAVQRLSSLTGELQERILKTRMHPVGSMWDRFPRILRDLALACGKQARLETHGEETELDRTVIEAIGEPLVHLLRNAVDHGIEAPEKRRSLGKPEEGVLVLRAFQEGGQVVLEFSDDGAGLNANYLRAKALKARLITAEQAMQMTEQEALNLVFLPGISTAEKVTRISGRGVGMDVVRTNIERIGGTIDIQSKRGVGTTFRIRIPLTLAIIPALIVRCGLERLALPQRSLKELVRLEPGDTAAAIERLHNARVYRLRGNLLPLVFLDEVLGLAPPDGVRPGGLTIAVLEAEDRPFGLVVDDVSDSEEIVVKPLGRHLKGLEVYSGATLLGDGRVALILDVAGLARSTGVLSRSAERALVAPLSDDPTPAPEVPRRPLLLLRGKDDGRLAVPLDRVTRLEEIESRKVERAGGQEVVQYRGEIMPLLHLRHALPERRQRPRAPDAPEAPAPERLHVVVATRGGRSVGLVVERILDIVEDSFAAERPSTRRGVARCAVIRDRITEILDLDLLLGDADGGAAPENAS